MYCTRLHALLVVENNFFFSCVYLPDWINVSALAEYLAIEQGTQRKSLDGKSSETKHIFGAFKHFKRWKESMWK